MPSIACSNRPDVYAIDAPQTQTIVGEAKTQGDLETEHTHKQFAGFPLNNTRDRGLSQRLRWDTVARTDLEAARRECYWVIIRGNLDIVRELPQHLHNNLLSLVSFGDCLFAAVHGLANPGR